ncbi:MAG: hypothetical protein ASARMPRED_009375 [Alectoria sarmentosa]|nr:MAG: hypothetical protein ASARMPRED_009375 [Alectoria sarmentosa]
MSDSHWSAPKVSSKIFLGHHWGVVAVSLCFISFRIGVRVRYFNRIWADDILMIVAWFMLCATATLYQTQSVNLYNQYPLLTGKIPPTQTNLARERTLLNVFVAEYYLFYTTLWMVKLSILLCFRRLFAERRRAPWLKAWWRFVTGVTVSTWAACIGTLPYSCLLKSLPWILSKCTKQDKINYSWINLQLSCATDITTEVMILIIPVIGLWKVQISFKKKLALLGIFCLTVITILFAVIRIAVMPNKTSTADITWLCFWAHIETGAAVIVACLASFRQLFVMSNQSGSDKQIPSSESSTDLGSSRIKVVLTRFFHPLSKALSGLKSFFFSSQTRPHTAEYQFSNKSAEDSLPWGTIPVDQAFGSSTQVYLDEMEKPVQNIYTTAYPATARYDFEIDTESGGKEES